jgi:hypothetical protein
MKLTENQIKQLRERRAEQRAERDQRHEAVCSQFPVATAYDIVQVARYRAWDMLFEDDDVPGIEIEANEAATHAATAHTLAMVMVALHAAKVSDPSD